MSIVAIQTMAGVCVGFVLAACAHYVSERLSQQSAAKRMVRRVLCEEYARLLAVQSGQPRDFVYVDTEAFVAGGCETLVRIAMRLGVGPLDDEREPAERAAAKERAE